MAKIVSIISNPGPVLTFNVEAGAAGSIIPGYPVKIGGTGNNYVVGLATGDPEIGTDRMIGVAVSTSTDTASADGTVQVQTVVPNMTVMRAEAQAGANLADGILLDSVTFDLATGDYTIDENEGDDPDVHGLVVVDYDADADTVDFMLKSGASLSGEIA